MIKPAKIDDDLDAAVAEACRWPEDLTDEQILEHLVALNHERALRRAAGSWAGSAPTTRTQPGNRDAASSWWTTTRPRTRRPKETRRVRRPPRAPSAWPKTLADEKTIASAFTRADRTRADRTRLAELLATLDAIGKARQLEDGRYVAA